MKKVLSILSIAMMLSLGLFTSCKHNTGNYDNSIDTVITLSTPKVSAKNYPGVNYVYWNSVQNAEKYYFSKYENNVLISRQTYNSTTLSYTDSDIKNNVSYTYKVQAIGNLSSSRSVYTADSAEGSYTVKGILPPASTSALNLAAYEGGYSGKEKSLSGDEKGKYLLKASNISVYEDKGKMVLSFPAKAYLTYTIYVTNGNLFDKTGYSEEYASAVTNFANNQTLSVAVNKSVSGTYSFKIKAAARYNTSYYPTTDTVDVEETVTVDSLNVNYGSNLSASYIDNGSTVRVKWIPVTLTTGSMAPLNYYKVYRTEFNAGDYSEIETSVKKDNVSNYYYIDDNTVDSSKIYTYLVVITDGEKYGSYYGQVNSNVYNTTGSIGTPSADYIDNGRTVRVSFDTTKLTDGSVAKPENYAVYRKTGTSADTVQIVGELKYTDASLSSMFIDDTITDNTVGYYYYIVLTDNNSVKYSSYAYLNAYTKTAVGKPTVSSSAVVKHTDGLKDDITWTITLADAETTCKVYLLKKDLKSTTNPVYGDFDLLSPLEITPATAVDQKTYKVYTDSVGIGKVYMLVIASKEDYADSYTISNPVEVAEPEMSQPTLSVSVYDNTITATTPVSYTPVDNDVIINVTDTLSTETENIANYTYTLYRAKSLVDSDIASITWTIDNEWVKVCSVTMNSNESYNPADTTVTYVGVVEEENVPAGLYGYKLVKTDIYGKSKVSSISYVSIADDSVYSISYKPTLSVAWKNTGSGDFIEIEFVKDTITDSIEEEHSGVTRVVGMEDEVPEAGVTYKLYRSTLVDEGNKTSVVFKLVGIFEDIQYEYSSYTQYTWNENTSTWNTGVTTEYIEKLRYVLATGDVSTGNTYQFIVVASKEGSADEISSSVTLAGAN